MNLLHRNKLGLRASVGGVLVATMLASGAGAAFAKAPPVPLATRRAECVSEINRRVTALGQAQARIDASKRLTTEQKASIDANIGAVVTHLNTVNLPAVESAATTAGLAAACSAVYLDNRVFVVVLPELVYLARLDVIGNFNDKVIADAGVAEAAGKDVAAVLAKTAEATAALTAAAARLVEVTPASYNADPASVGPVWNAVQSDLLTAFFATLTAHQLLSRLP